MTNYQIVKRYRTLSKRSLKLIDELIEAGHGSLTSSEMRKDRTENPLFNKYLSIVDEMNDLRTEAEKRYGPGLIRVEQLIYR